MRPDELIRERAEALKALSQWRDPAGAAEGWEPAEGGGVRVDARSNDYLGLAGRVVSRETVEPGVVAGAGASRLISGTQPEHLELEACLAEWLHVESALLFSSGYAANVGAVSALAGEGDVVISDALNHASLIDGCRLGRAKVVVVPHLDLAAFEDALARASAAAARWVVTESYFGMDGDVPDLRALRRLCDAHGAGLIVDEAHALGVFGDEGRGLCAEAGVMPEVLVGGMGKGLGVQGGFAAGSSTFRGWLWNRARSFVFSTAPSPLVCRLALQQLWRLRGADRERRRLSELESRLERELLDGGVPLGRGRRGPLFPIVFGTERCTLDAAAALRRVGVGSHAIRPPTVPPGASRLRVTVRADMTDEQIERLGAGLVEVWKSASPTLADALSSAGAPAPSVPDPASAPSVPDPCVPKVPGPSSAPSVPGAFAPKLPDPGVPGTAGTGFGASIPGTGFAASVPDPASAPSIAGLASAPSIPRAALGEKEGLTNPAKAPLARRWVVLGTGTDVGKSFVAEALVRLLAATGDPVAGLKPVETGLARAEEGRAHGDAIRLQQASFHVKHPTPHPLFGFPDPVTPSLAARRASTRVDLESVRPWLEQVKADGTDRTPALVIETAGGVFSPLNDSHDNLDLAVALGPAEWILVAPDRLGTLHDVLSTLRAMESAQRAPDWIILSAVRNPDASSGTNAAELRRRKLKPRIISLGLDETAPLQVILERPSF